MVLLKLFLFNYNYIIMFKTLGTIFKNINRFTYIKFNKQYINKKRRETYWIEPYSYREGELYEKKSIIVNNDFFTCTYN